MELHFTEDAQKDYLYWKRHDPRKAKRIEQLCKDILLHPFEGIGKPEPLRFELHGCWSRRIDQQHRLVYELQDGTILVDSCRYHY